MARALTGDERARYPWASRIDDYVPVGRLRKAAVLLAVAGLVAVLVGVFVSLVLNENIHHAVNMHHRATAYGIYLSMALTGAGAVLGVVLGIAAVVRKATALLWWTVAAVVPAAVVYLLIWPALK